MMLQPQILDSPNLLTQSPYQDYVYSYPHKTAYRPLDGRSLQQVWSQEKLSTLFLYIHVPFCEMRCGFCNLFTTVMHDDDFVSQYVRAVERQAISFRKAMEAIAPGKMQFARFALGGGTPTQLSLAGLESILNIAEATLRVKLQQVPMSVEVSPDTATLDKLKLLRDRGTDRISMGVQSFIDREVMVSQRRQTAEQVKATIRRIHSVGFRTLNLDLIYGLPGQTVETWLQSVRTALQFHPEELYLYPLYVRPLTGLGLSNREWDDIRLTCYRAGRALLLEQGYTQVSMRMFRAPHATDTPGPVYCCQADAMVGLGCGARSYTRSLHYSYDYAVNAKEIRGILEHYMANNEADFCRINYGCELDRREQQHRYLLLSLLSDEGLDLVAYGDRFHSDVISDFPQLRQFQAQELLQQAGKILQLTPAGLERSDAIGPSFFSPNVRTLMNQYQIK